MSESRLQLRGAERGQTLPDFAVGIAIFLLTISFIVVFVPQLTLPFEDQEQPVVAERITNDLGENLLAEREAPSMLNESRTLSFFEGELEADQLGIDPRYSVNVTLRDAPSDAPNSTMLCEDGAGESIVDCNGGSKLAVGPSVPPDDRSVSTARVSVFTGETQAVLEVRVW